MCGFFLSHTVLVLLCEGAQLAPEVDVNLEVEVPLVPLVGLHSEDAKDFLSLLAGDVVFQVEDGLLPVGVGSLGGSGEANAFVAFGELDVEEGHESLQIIVQIVKITSAGSTKTRHPNNST